MIKYSVVAPVYNEEGNLENLVKEITPIMDSLKEKWELVLVNDGSSDNSLEELKSIKSKELVIVNFRRNYGQATAMDAGFKQAKGEIVITLDADLQNDPKDIPRLLEKMQKDNLDVVAGWRHKRKDPFWMIFVTTAAKILRKMFANDGVHDSGCTLRVYKSKFTKDLELTGEMHRYIMALLKWKGAKTGELRVNHRKREVGVSKYNWKKSFKGLVDLFYIVFWKKFSIRPLHLFGIAGLFSVGFGVLAFFWTLFLKVVRGVSLSDSVWFIMSAFLVMIGVQLFISGIMFDLMIRTYYNTGNEKRYVVDEVIENSKKKASKAKSKSKK